ncbi:MAG: TIGR04372 family glycosyltransferase [Acidobacteriota bacterium]
MTVEFLYAVDGLLISRPNGRQFGHLALEILMSMAEARARRVPLCILPPRRPVNPTLLDLESEVVHRVHPRLPARVGYRARLAAADVVRLIRPKVSRVTDSLRDELGKELASHVLDPTLPDNLRGYLRQLKRSLAGDQARTAARNGQIVPYFHRRLIRDCLPVYLPADVHERACTEAERLGIGRTSRIVTIHAREGGFKMGYEVHEKHRRLGSTDVRDDGARNASIETYFDAIDLLVARGYTIVRLGDRTMTPLRRAGVVDLATCSGATARVQVHSLMRSDFLLSGEAGPVGVSYLTNTPVLNVNVTDPISSYPVRKDGIYVFKTVVDRFTGQALKPVDLLGADYLAHLRDTGRFAYVDNTPKDIVLAVEEMLQGLSNRWSECEAQAVFRDRATEAAEAYRRELSYVRKWGADDGFLGDGRIARFLAERYADRGVSAPASMAP